MNTNGNAKVSLDELHKQKNSSVERKSIPRSIIIIVCRFIHHYNSSDIETYAPFLFCQGFSTPTTIIATTMRRMRIPMHIHFLELLCKLLAFWRAVFPDCTWSTADETWEIQKIERQFTKTVDWKSTVGHKYTYCSYKFYLWLYVIKHVPLSIHQYCHVQEYLKEITQVRNKDFALYEPINQSITA